MRDNEKWIQVTDFPMYWVSELGKIYSNHKRRMIKPKDNGKGYLYIVLCGENGIRKRRLVHHMVYRAFIGEIPHGLEINHRNGNKSDNSKGNIETMTHAENTKHAGDHQLVPNGVRHHNSKLTDGRVHLIREMKKTGQYLNKEIAEAIGVCSHTVSLVCRRITWRHIPEIA